MNRTEFGFTWDDTSPMDATLKARIPPQLFESLERYFQDCIETGGFLRAVLENDLNEAVNRSRYSLDRNVIYDVVALLDGWAPKIAWGSKEAVAEWLARPERMAKRT